MISHVQKQNISMHAVERVKEQAAKEVKEAKNSSVGKKIVILVPLVSLIFGTAKALAQEDASTPAPIVIIKENKKAIVDFKSGQIEVGSQKIINFEGDVITPVSERFGIVTGFSKTQREATATQYRTETQPGASNTGITVKEQKMMIGDQVKIDNFTAKLTNVQTGLADGATTYTYTFDIEYPDGGVITKETGDIQVFISSTSGWWSSWRSTNKTKTEELNIWPTPTFEQGMEFRFISWKLPVQTKMYTGEMISVDGYVVKVNDISSTSSGAKILVEVFDKSGKSFGTAEVNSSYSSVDLPKTIVNLDNGKVMEIVSTDNWVEQGWATLGATVISPLEIPIKQDFSLKLIDQEAIGGFAYLGDNVTIKMLGVFRNRVEEIVPVGLVIPFKAGLVDNYFTWRVKMDFSSELIKAVMAVDDEVQQIELKARVSETNTSLKTSFVRSEVNGQATQWNGKDFEAEVSQGINLGSVAQIDLGGDYGAYDHSVKVKSNAAGSGASTSDYKEIVGGNLGLTLKLKDGNISAKYGRGFNISDNRENVENASLTASFKKLQIEAAYAKSQNFRKQSVRIGCRF